MNAELITLKCAGRDCQAYTVVNGKTLGRGRLYDPRVPDRIADLLIESGNQSCRN
jgi:hypothetical protein